MPWGGYSWSLARLLVMVLRQGWLLLRLLLDPRVPGLVKVIPLLSFLYLLSPVDLFPDLFFGLGQLDDLAVLLVGLRLFLELVPKVILREYTAQGNAGAGRSAPKRPPEADSTTIEGTYRIVDEGEGR